jgi:hypothetical protein
MNPAFYHAPSALLILLFLFILSQIIFAGT